MAAKTLFWKSTCTTCRDARAALRAAGHDVEEVNYAKRALTRDEVHRLVQAAGSVASVLNTRHATAKANGWAKAPPSLDEYVAAALIEPNLLRRPILIVDGRAIVGFDRAAYSALAPG